MNACKLDMLHNSGNKAVLAVRDSVSLTLCCVVEETVDEYRSVGGNADCRRHIDLHHFIIVNNLHTSAAENV